ncbi:OmpH family outer membrane protein [bacterium]|nr:OmpH family outer membrane protein [bacterium]
MKKFVAVMSVLLMLGLLVASPVLAKDVKVGIIISERILNEYSEAQDAQKILSEDISEWQRQASQMEDELNAMQEELGQQAMMFYSEEKKAEKQASFQQKLNEYRQFQSTIEQRAYQRNQELFAPINEKIQKVIDTIAAEDGYDVIFDAVGTAIAYANPELDITERVLEELKKAGTGSK